LNDSLNAFRRNSHFLPGPIRTVHNVSAETAANPTGKPRVTRAFFGDEFDGHLYLYEYDPYFT
jgi:hypothetical protein